MIYSLKRPLAALLAVVAVATAVGCGYGRGSGVAGAPASIGLIPGSPVSLTIGTTQGFSATAKDSFGQVINAAFSFQSSDTSILNFSPAGNACAGTWNAPVYTVCTALGTGVVQVTAKSGNVTSPPTFVFVHNPVDQIKISVVPPVNPQPACTGQQNIAPACTPVNVQPTNSCFTGNQPQTLQATAFSQGLDITATVGPFTWLSGISGVVTVTPTISTSTNVPTNMATAAPGTPGFTQVVAQAAGSSSQPFDFETCPVQCVAVEIATGSPQSGQTSFIVNKSTAVSLEAWAVDVQGCLVPKPALTWVTSQPPSIQAGGTTTGCAAGTTCALTTPQPGSASITATCTPPTCNVGFPLSPTAGITPQPVYPVTAISGLVNGLPGTFNIIATSTSCAKADNPNCTVSLYDLTSGKSEPGSIQQIPTPPNSFLFSPHGDKAYMGSPFGAQLVATANLGTTSNAFTPIPAAGTTTGFVQGKVLAVSPKGDNAIFADNVSNPNFVYFVNDLASGPASTPLNITGATSAAFSPDGLKAFIVGFDRQNNPKLFVFSLQQSLQSFNIPAGTSVQEILPSATGAFMFTNGGGAAPSLGVRNVCNNQPATDPANAPPALNLPAQPVILKALPPGNFPTGSNTIPKLLTAGLDILMGVDNTGIEIVATNAAQPGQNALCPQTITLAKLQANPSQTFAPLHLDLGQGNFSPINFFLSPDETLVYIVPSNLSAVLVYNLNTRSTSAIQLVGPGTPLPVAADMTPDGSFIYVAANDGQVHAISTFPAVDLFQVSFPSAPNATNPFCSNAITQPSCTLDFIAVVP